MSKIKIAVIGAGQRGNIYAEHIANSEEAEIVAVVEPFFERREAMKSKYQIREEMAFDNIDDFYNKGKICDAVIISTMDRLHFDMTMKALELGYDILLEKPISPVAEECVLIEDKAKAKGNKLVIAHVLRYAPIYSKLKEIIESGEIGKVISIQHNENIGNFHMAHSFVRGNWKNKNETSPIILQKSSHDFDILTWLVNSKSRKIASFGELTYFKKENAPYGSGEKCLECPVADKCRYDAKKVYLPIKGEWPATAVTEDQTEEGILKALKSGPYGQCVYKCDNNVCDHQATIIEFENGVTATFNLSAFTNKIKRTFKIMCEDGEIRGDDSKNELQIIKFSSNQDEPEKCVIINPKNVEGFHGGGDFGLIKDFISVLSENTQNSKTSIEKSIESHLMAFAAEESRVSNKMIIMNEYRNKILESAIRRY